MHGHGATAMVGDRFGTLATFVDRRTQASAYYLLCHLGLSIPWLGLVGSGFLVGRRIHPALGLAAAAVLLVLCAGPVARAHRAALHRVLGVDLRPYRLRGAPSVAGSALVSFAGLVAGLTVLLLWILAVGLLWSPCKYLINGRGVFIFQGQLGPVTVDISDESLLIALVSGLVGVVVSAVCLLLTRGAARLLSSLVGRLLNSGSTLWSLDRPDDGALRRDLHDGVQQSLVALALELDMAKEAIGAEHGARQRIDRAHDGARQALAELRSVTSGRPTTAAHDGELADTLHAVAQRLHLSATVAVDLPATTPVEVTTAAYYIAVESLVNVAKHAGVAEASVRLRGERGFVDVQVRDNGRGGARAAADSGLAGLAARAAGLGGRLTVDSPPGGPTVVTAELPCGS